MWPGRVMLGVEGSSSFVSQNVLNRTVVGLRGVDMARTWRPDIHGQSNEGREHAELVKVMVGCWQQVA
jgi:hypothetical protein